MPHIDFNQACIFLQQIKQSVQRDIMGQEEVIDGLIIALISGGHVLLEGNPGLGKTTLAKAFAKSLRLGSEGYGRIQFTPDLLPSDITGTYMPDLKSGGHEFSFQHGPIFHQILLADEINRATPKTQAAMLEAMAEKQVTVMGEPYELVTTKPFIWNGQNSSYETPFMVIGTQNPIDQEGTYDLPEAQADRFQQKLLMQANDTETLMKIVEREAMGQKHISENKTEFFLDKMTSDEALFQVHNIRQLALFADIPNIILRHATYIVQATNGFIDEKEMRNLTSSNRRDLAEFVSTFIEAPLGPRTARDLILSTKIKALLLIGADAAEEWQRELPSALTAITAGVLRHRLKLNPDWPNIAKREFPSLSGEQDPEAIRNAIISQFLSLTAPIDQNGSPDYANFFPRSRK
ncbi:MAG: AAA family ATPase [Lentilitoribacter sp.]